MDLQTRTNEIASNMIKTQENYRAMVEECAKDGYRAPYCIHGPDNWTDYDNICYGCEEENGFSEYSTEDEIRVMAREAAIQEHNQKISRAHSAAIAIDMAMDFASECSEKLEGGALDRILAIIFRQYGI